MDYKTLSLEELEKDVFYSKRMLPYLTGGVYKSYQEWINKKEERIKFLIENKIKDGGKNYERVE